MMIFFGFCLLFSFLAALFIISLFLINGNTPEKYADKE